MKETLYYSKNRGKKINFCCLKNRDKREQDGSLVHHITTRCSMYMPQLTKGDNYLLSPYNYIMFPELHCSIFFRCNMHFYKEKGSRSQNISSENKENNDIKQNSYMEIFSQFFFTELYFLFATNCILFYFGLYILISAASYIFLTFYC